MSGVKGQGPEMWHLRDEDTCFISCETYSAPAPKHSFKERIMVLGQNGRSICVGRMTPAVTSIDHSLSFFPSVR